MNNEQKAPQEILDMLTKENVHAIYTETNWDTILLGNEKPALTIDQFDDMWVSYFDSFGFMRNPVKDAKDHQERLISLSYQMGILAGKVYPLENFMNDIVKDRDLIEVGFEIAKKGVEQTYSEQRFVDFRKNLSEKQCEYREKYGHPADIKNKQR